MPKGRTTRRTVLALAFVLAAALAALQAQAPGDSTGVLHFGFSAALLEDANPADAMAAMVVWVRAVGQAAGAYKDAEASVFPDQTSLLKAAGHTDLFALSTTDYLSLESTLQGDPCMAFMVSGEVETDYVLLARSGTTSLATLRDTRLLIQNQSGQRRVVDVWMDVLLMEAGFAERERFWPAGRTVGKASQAILPLYFGQADAALVTRSAFDTARELNPDLGRKLTIVARSPKLLPGLICARRNMSPDLKRRYVESATTIHEKPQFKQTFMVLRMNRLVPWDPHYLDNARTVLTQYQALRRKTGGK